MTRTQSPTLLTIAGYDPSSGAGITADLQVFGAHGYFGTSAITGLTVQSTTGVRRMQPVDAALLAETLDCLHDDLPPGGVKIGMLADAPQVHAVALYLRRLRSSSSTLTVVLDPVLQSSSGRRLLSDAGAALLLQELLPLVDVVTPNTDELCALTGMACDTQDAREAAASRLGTLSPRMSVLVTGGDDPEPNDTLLHAGHADILRGQRIETRATHGTGCAMSSALLCALMAGDSVPAAAIAAKRYVEGALRHAESHGAGKGPMHLLWPLSVHPSC